LAGPAWGVEARPGVPPAAAIPLLRDMRLTVRVRQLLLADGELAPLNLGVKVRGGVATLWGPVPSAALGRKAVCAVEALPGISEVRNELVVTPPPGRLDELMMLPAPEPPARVQPAAPERESAPLPPLDWPALVDAGGAAREPGALPPLGDNLPVVSVRKPVLLLAPVAAGKVRRAAATESPAGPLAAKVERVRRTDSRFRTIRVELQGRTVVLHGGESPGEDVMALARALSRLSGVERVVLQDGR
jgi:hypothetical protein